MFSPDNPQWRKFLDESLTFPDNANTDEQSRLVTDLAEDYNPDRVDDNFDDFWGGENTLPPPPPLPSNRFVPVQFLDNDYLAVDIDSSGDDKQPECLYVKNKSELDSFLNSVYSYYIHGGMGAFFLAKLTDFLKLVFMALLFYFVGACIDFPALLESLQQTKAAGGVHEHVKLSDFVYYRGLAIWCYPLAIVFGIYICTMSVRSVYQVHKMFAVRDFYHFELNLYRVHSLAWSEVVERILASKEMQSVGIGSSPLDVVGRLTRQTNYFVALVASDSLVVPEKEQTALTQPWNGMFSNSFGNFYDESIQKRPIHPTMTQTLEWALQRTLFSFAFPHSVQLRPELAALVDEKQKLDNNNLIAKQKEKVSIQKSDEWNGMILSLSNRFRIMAVLGILFSPFVFCFLLVDFLLESGQQFRSQPKNILSTRHWSSEARWAFREYNELPHYFRRRLARAYQPADKFISMFSKPKTTIVARFLAYCVGSIMFLLICFGLAYDDDALTRVDILLDRSALWWLGVLGALIAFLRTYVPDENVVFEPRKHLHDTAQYTHFMPRCWIDKEHTASVRKDFSRFFQYRWTDTACELFSVVFTPYLLWSVFPRRAEALLRFIVENTHDDKQLGHICRYSLLRVDLDGDHLYGGRYKTLDREPAEPDNYCLQNGKLETSLVNFIRDYPAFRPDVHSSMFIDNVVERNSSLAPLEASESRQVESQTQKIIEKLLLSANKRAV